MKGCSIFGGFIRSHFSGKPWTDLDLLLPAEVQGLTSNTDFMAYIVNFVAFVLEVRTYRISYTIHSCNSYGGASVDFLVKLQDRDDIVIKLDVIRSNRGVQGTTYLPVTVGSCLQIMPDLAIVKRSVKATRNIDGRLKHFTIPDIISMLENGEDVKLCLKTKLTGSSASLYRTYYWCRISKIESNGWSLIGKDGNEPEPFNGEELETAMKVVSIKKEEEAGRIRES